MSPTENIQKVTVIWPYKKKIEETTWCSIFFNLHINKEEIYIGQETVSSKWNVFLDMKKNNVTCNTSFVYIWYFMAGRVRHPFTYIPTFYIVSISMLYFSKNNVQYSVWYMVK